MKLSPLARRIQELSAKLQPIASEGIRFDFNSFTEPEQLVLLKNFELDEKYRGRWTRKDILENKDIILKGNHIVITRALELFQLTMPKALMLDELEQWFFEFNFHNFLENWIECQKNLRRRSKKDREDFLRDIKGDWKKENKTRREAKHHGEENNN
jgi:hypothetical protein